MLNTSVPRPRDLDPVGLAAVEDVLARHLQDQEEVLLAVDASLAEVVKRVRAPLAKGKRLRAAFCLWGARAAAGHAPVAEGAHAAAVTAGAALELFHLAALVHDDVMDRSQVRRGEPTTHRSFARLHRDAGFVGDASAFGESVAVLVGDLCLTGSDDLMARALAQAPAPEARAVWERMRTEVLAGQYLDLLVQAQECTQPAAAERVLRYKSAKYTVEHPLLLGASLAGAPPDLLAPLADLGLRVGEAFQLRDDVLGLYGDPEVTGKPAHDDVREGKRTMLVAFAEEAAGEHERAVLRQHLGDPDLDADGLAAFRGVIESTGSLERVEDRITSLMGGAHALLDEMALPERPRQALAALSDACAWRAA